VTDGYAHLRRRVEAAARAAFGSATADIDALLHRSAHADYQADIAMALGRQIRRAPREVAAELVDHLSADEVLERAEVSGPGFINLHVRTAFLAAQLDRMSADERLGVPRAAPSDTVVVDYSGPNVAKEMHVGHLRSTIIGDAIARLLEYQGHSVVRQNHLGDWGTPFGMLIEHLYDEGAADADTSVRALGAFYRAARAKFEGDPGFADRARRRVVSLQGGDQSTVSLWRRLIEVSLEHFSAIYRRLGVGLRSEHVAGESGYQDALPGIVAELQARGVARQSEGAVCVFLPEFTGRDGKMVPLIVRKHDGGYGYGTTDLAALRHRVRALGAQRIIYVVGAPQSQHLAMVFETARAAGWAPKSVRLEHVPFGSVLGADKRMLKTRAGEAVSLVSLLDEALEQAERVVAEKSPDLDSTGRTRIAEAVGIGAIKYADLASDRVKDYVFDWNRMLSFEGNTAPYLMYAHARIRSLLRKAQAAGLRPSGSVALDAPEERAISLELLELPSVIARTADTLQPHRLCGYLYEVARRFTTFYESCPVLRAEPATCVSRLTLCELTARVLHRGLALVGVDPPEQM
jgi:arginyl-tRNA synthetase